VRRRVGPAAIVVLLSITAGVNGAPGAEWACYPIQAGDTAARLAVRLTGSAESRHQAGFQIADPASPRFLSKAQYDDIRPGWLACIVRDSMSAGTSDAEYMDVMGAGGPSLMTIVLLALAGGVLSYIGDRYWHDRQAAVGVMTHFGEAFIAEFERPLVQSPSGERPIQHQLRVKPHQGRVEVLLAPGAGRRYPNLSDQRQNLEYDVARVLDALRGQPFVSGRLQQQGPWVVVPLQFTRSQQQAGAM
jgi:hypothetical protein